MHRHAKTIFTLTLGLLAAAAAELQCDPAHLTLRGDALLLGVLPPVAACVFPPQIGIKKAVELNAVGMTIDAHEAQAIGLVSQVCPTDVFDEHVAGYLEGIRKLSRPVVRLAKRATIMMAREQILTHLDRVEKLYLDELMKVSDAHEGIAAFIEKRAPKWTHA